MALHPKIEALTRTKRQNGDYDGAIRDATEFIEAQIQAEIGSKAINTKLIEDAFDGAKLVLSRKSDLNFGGKSLFDGFFRLIRNDRGHWKTPTQDIEIPCTSDDQCEWYLGLASLLLFYIESRNLVNAPVISSYRPTIGASNQLEIDGTNLGKGEVLIDGQHVSVTQQRQNYILVPIPVGVVEGSVQVKVGEMMSNKMDFSLGDTTHKNTFEVIETDIPLYADAACTQRHPGVKGIKVKVYEKGRVITRVNPTTASFNIGDYLSQESRDWTIGGQSVGETWYQDSMTGEKKYAWTGSAVFNGTTIGKVGKFKPIRLSIRPSKILLGQGERRAVQAQLIAKDSLRVNVEFVTDSAQWTSEDPSIAYINEKGELIAKKFGKTVVHCKHGSLHDAAEVEVATITPGQITEIFGGITHLQEIRFDSQGNLFISYQSPVIAMLTHDGKFIESILRLPTLGDSEQRIDRIFLDHNDDLYVRTSGPGCVHKFLKSDNYQRPQLIKEGSFGDMVADASSTIFIGTFKNHILKIDQTGEKILPTAFNPLGVQLLGNGNLVLASGNSIYVSDRDGNLLKQINIPELSGATDIAVQGDEVFAVGFHGKNVARVNLVTDKYSIIANLDGIPGGIDIGPDNNLYISIFTEGDSIQKIYL